MRKKWIIIWALVLLSFIMAGVFYSYLPDRLATHWDYNGNVNGYSSKFVGLFIFPLISLILVVILLVLPLIFPLRENIEKIRKYYDNFIILFLLFLLLVFSFTISWNLGYVINIVYFMPIAFFILLFYLGIVLEKSKRNWVIGIRTPWTLSSDYVWDKTHKLGGKLFKICALISLMGLFFGSYGLWFVLVPVILSSLYLFVYSYLIYREEQKKGKRKKRR